VDQERAAGVPPEGDADAGDGATRCLLLLFQLPREQNADHVQTHQTSARALGRVQGPAVAFHGCLENFWACTNRCGRRRSFTCATMCSKYKRSHSALNSLVVLPAFNISGGKVVGAGEGGQLAADPLELVKSFGIVGEVRCTRLHLRAPVVPCGPSDKARRSRCGPSARAAGVRASRYSYAWTATRQRVTVKPLLFFFPSRPRLTCESGARYAPRANFQAGRHSTDMQGRHNTDVFIPVLLRPF
jgi:hypothetical protein